MEEPLKLTIAPWHNVKRGKTKRDSMGFQDDKWMKAFALKDRPVDSYAYGTVTEGYSGTQAGIVCAPHTGLLVIDVDDHETFDWSLVEGMKPTTKTGGGGFHYYVDGRNIPADQWPTQGPIAGGDIKSNGFVPAPGTRHWNGHMYEPIGDPAETLYVGTPELFARLRAARAAHDASRTRSGRVSVGLGASQQHGDDNALTRLVFDYAQILDDERLYALWQHEARKIEDPADPFEREDFERHLKGAREKLGPPVDPDSLSWYMDPSKGGGAHGEDEGGQGGDSNDEYVDPAVTWLKEEQQRRGKSFEKGILKEFKQYHDRNVAQELFTDYTKAMNPPPKLKLLGDADVSARPRAEWLIRGKTPKQGYGMDFGREGSGKSLLKLLELHCIGSGQPFMGMQVNARGTCVYFMGEGAFDLQDRREALYTEYPLLNRECVKYVLMEDEPEPLFLDIDQHIDRLIDQLSEIKDLRVVCFDTATNFVHGNLNSGADGIGKRVAQGLIRLASALGCWVEIVHHPGKQNTTQAKGDTTLAQLAFAVNRVADGNLISEKNKGGKFNPVAFEIVKHGNGATVKRAGLEEAVRRHDENPEEVRRRMLTEILAARGRGSMHIELVSGIASDRAHDMGLERGYSEASFKKTIGNMIVNDDIDVLRIEGKTKFIAIPRVIVDDDDDG